MDLLENRHWLMKALKGLKEVTTDLESDRVKGRKLDADSEKYEVDVKVQLVVSLMKLPPITESGAEKVYTVRSRVPHNFIGKESSVLCIVKNEWQKKALERRRISWKSAWISEYMTLKDLEVNYKDYECRRALAARTDVVLCDNKIAKMLPTRLGKAFYKAKKRPIEIVLSKKRTSLMISRGLSRCYLYLGLVGSCATCQVGRTRQSNSYLASNILAVVKDWKKKLPGGWDNVASIHVKTPTSKSLPLYIGEGTPNAVQEVADPMVIVDPVLAVTQLDRFDSSLAVGVKKSGDVVLLPAKEKLQKKVLKDVVNKPTGSCNNKDLRYWSELNRKFNSFGKMATTFQNMYRYASNAKILKPKTGREVAPELNVDVNEGLTKRKNQRLLKRRANKKLVMLEKIRMQRDSMRFKENEVAISNQKWDEFENLLPQADLLNTKQQEHRERRKKVRTSATERRREIEKRVLRKRGKATKEEIMKTIVNPRTQRIMKWYPEVPGWGPRSKVLSGLRQKAQKLNYIPGNRRGTRNQK